MEVVSPHPAVNIGIHTTDDDNGRIEGSSTCRDLQEKTQGVNCRVGPV